MTVVALGVGVGYGMARSAAADRASDARAELDALGGGGRDACVDPALALAGPCSRLDAANRDGARASQLATIGFVGAGVAAAATLATWVLWEPEPGGYEVGVSAGPGGWLGRWSGSF